MHHAGSKKRKILSKANGALRQGRFKEARELYFKVEIENEVMLREIAFNIAFTEARAEWRRLSKSDLARTLSELRESVGRLPVKWGGRPASETSGKTSENVTQQSPHGGLTRAVESAGGTPYNKYTDPRLRHILFVSGEPKEKPGFTYRLRNMAGAFERLGYVTTCLSLNEILDYEDFVKRSEFVVVWRARWGGQIEGLYRAAHDHGICVYYDLDDLMVRPDLVDPQIIDAIRFNQNDVEKVKTHYTSIREACVRSDGAIATTNELAWNMRAQKGQHPVVVVENGFTEEVYNKSRAEVWSKSTEPNDGLVRIGYAGGSRSHQRDFSVCVQGLAEVLAEHPSVRLVLFHKNGQALTDVAEFPELSPYLGQVEWREMVEHKDLPSELTRFDINIAPLEVGNPFVESKSELKYFEAALCSVPTIASPAEPFTRAITSQVNGVLAYTGDDWKPALTWLVESAGDRERIGKTAHLSALWHYGPTRRVELAYTIAALDKGGRAAARAFAEYSNRLTVPNEPVAAPAGYVTRDIRCNHNRARVTVIIPMYNYAQTIIEALESVKRQSLRDLDLVVVDDASTDSSCERVLEWVSDNADRFGRLQVITHTRNKGLGAARNTAFGLSDTLYVMCLDADNVLYRRCCEVLLSEIVKSNAAFAYPKIERFGDRTGYMGGHEYCPWRFVSGNYVDAMALVSREVWSFVGGYVEHRLGWQDFDFWCRIISRGLSGTHVAEVLAGYRVHGQSMLHVSTNRGNNKEQLVGLMESTFPWLSLHQCRSGHHRSD